MRTYLADTVENPAVDGPSARFTYQRIGPRGGISLVLLHHDLLGHHRRHSAIVDQRTRYRHDPLERLPLVPLPATKVSARNTHRSPLLPIQDSMTTHP